MKLKKQSEKEFMANVIQLARLHGWLVYHTHDSRRCPPGFPDLVLCKPPLLLFAELKREKGRITTEQQVWLDKLRASKQRVYLWRPADWPDIQQILSE